MDMNSGGNPWYRATIKKLADTTKQRKELESAMRPDKMSLYERVLGDQAEEVAEVLKMGNPFEYDDSMITFITEDGNSYQIERKSVEKALGEAVNVIKEGGQYSGPEVVDGPVFEKQETYQTPPPPQYDYKQSEGYQAPPPYMYGWPPYSGYYNPYVRQTPKEPPKPEPPKEKADDQPKSAANEFLKQIFKMQVMFQSIVSEAENAKRDSVATKKELENEIKSHESEKLLLTEKSSELDKKLSDFSMEKEKLIRAHEEATESLRNEFKTKTDKLRDEADSLNSKLSKMKNDFERVTKENGNLTTKNNSLSSENDKLKKELADLRKENDKKAKDINDKLNKALSDLDSEKAKFPALERERNDLKDEIERLKKDSPDKAELENLKSKVSELSKALEEAEKGNAESEELKTKMSELTDELTKATNDKESLEKRNADLSNEINELNERISDSGRAGVDELTDTGTQKALENKDYDISNVTVSYVNLDNLKTVTNGYGMQAGDKMLTQVSTALKNRFGDDNVFRFGGGFFVVKPVSEKNNTEFNLNDLSGKFRAANNPISHYTVDGRDFGSIKEARDRLLKESDREREEPEETEEEPDDEVLNLSHSLGNELAGCINR